MFCLVTILLITLLFLIFFFNPFQCKEHASNVIGPQHLGLGAYPAGLYGTKSQNTYYNDDLKAAMRYSDHFESMVGLKFPSYDINVELDKGRHGNQKTVDYI